MLDLTLIPFASAGKKALAAGSALILSEPLDAQERGWMDVANDADYGLRKTA
jgi:hypothetical protein